MQHTVLQLVKDVLVFDPAYIATVLEFWTLYVVFIATVLCYESLSSLSSSSS